MYLVREKCQGHLLIKAMNKPLCVSVVVSKGNNFYDFLVCMVPWDMKSFQIWAYSLKTEYALRGEHLPFKSRSLLRRDKMKWQGYLP